jgi:hypothetical protein
VDRSAKIIGIVLLLFFGIPLILAAAAPLLISGALIGAIGNTIDGDRIQISKALSADDIAFGGDEKQLLATYKRLRSMTASVADGRRLTRSLSVAVVTVTTNRAEQRTASTAIWRDARTMPRTKPIDVDLGNAGDGAVLLVANRPVLWSPVNAHASQRARIAIEGAAVFDIMNAQQGLLAGFRIGAFGVRDAADALDADSAGKRSGRLRFCKAVAIWARHFEVDPRDVRIWRFLDPDQISLSGDRLDQSGGTSSRPEFLSDFCR